MAVKKKAKKPAPKAVAKKPVAKKPVPKKKAAPAKAKAVAKKASAPKTAKPKTAKVTAKKPVAAPKKVVKKAAAPPAKPVAPKPAAPVKAPQKTIKLVVAPPPPVRKKPEPAKPVKVVIPEIKTKTAVKYRPDFTKSILDIPDDAHTGPTMRYSDSDLAEFRDLIQKKLEQAKKELTYLQGLITRKDEMGGDETENRYMTMEDGSMSMEREQLAQMASRQINYIDHLEKAMMRIENKTYGICRVTGKLIDKARLRAVPHATLSIEAKQMMNK